MQIKIEQIDTEIKSLLSKIHDQMFEKALQARLSHVKDVDNWADFMVAINERNICMTPWCDIQ